MTKKTFTVWLIIAIIAQLVLSAPVSAVLVSTVAQMVDGMFGGEMDDDYVEVWNGEMKDSFSGGSGSSDDPYLITDPRELAFLGFVVDDYNEDYNSENIHYLLCNDLDLNGIPWTPIGFDVGFRANFNGGNHVISGLYIDTGSIDSPYFGLFGENRGRIEYLNLRDVTVESRLSYARIGALCGLSSGNIFDCHAEDVSITFSGVPTSNSSLSAYGGLIGATSYQDSYLGTVERCSTSDSELMVNVGNVGGLIGYCETAVIDCYAENVDINTHNAFTVGGLVGELYETTREVDAYTETAIIERCYAEIIINSSATYVGGLIGRISDARVVDSYARGRSNANGSAGFGGFVGCIIGGKIRNCYCAFDSEASGVARTGGFVGTHTTSCYGNGSLDITYCVTYTMPKILDVEFEDGVGLFGCSPSLYVESYGRNVHDIYYLDENSKFIDGLECFKHMSTGESASRNSLESGSFYERMYWNDSVWKYYDVNIAEYSYPTLKCFE